MKIIYLGLVLGLLTAGPAWGGGSCAYEEGLMALERGHWQRAEVMLAIAAREGNAEAGRLLARLQARGQLALVSESASKVGLGAEGRILPSDRIRAEERD